ncbi:phage holin [Ursidibacter arcticus]|uniref:phage holin n=1 Tax=Ursidibacter arcticus TaxID=1524965 RepID=UPI0012F8FD42|nr:phage holin [Ursidibacter arcticus]KAE9536065.1 hypothetical protein A1D25_04085 [Ursidibacter arcticus]
MNKQDSTSLFGAFITVLTSLTLSDWGVILGIIFGASTILMNWYYKEREIKLKEKYYQKQLKDLDDEQKP